MKKYWSAIILAIFAVASRFVFLGLRPFDGDEGIILKIAQSANFDALIKAVANDVHPPIYHILEFLTFKVLPLNEFSARLVSALAGVIAIYFIYLFFRKISSEKMAFAVALLSVINPILTYHFAEARPYGLLTLFVFAQLYFFLKIKDHQTAKSEDGSDLFWFSVFSILMALTQYISFAIFVGEVFYLFLCEGRHKINWKKTLSGIITLAVFVLFWGKIFINQLQGRTAEQSQALNLKDNAVGLFNALYRFLAGRLFLDLDPSFSKNLEFMKNDPLKFIIFVLSVIVPIALFIWGIIALYQKKRHNFWLVIIVFAPVIIAALLSSEIGPRSVRYLLFLAPFAVYIVLKVFETRSTFLKSALFTVFIIIYLAAFFNGMYPERQKPGVNSIARFLKQNATARDSVLAVGGYGGGESFILNYYLGDKNGLQVDDLYGDYQVGNLSKVKERQIPDEIKKLKEAAPDKSVYMYDLTYTFDENTASMPFQKYDLGKDKENKALVLYKF